MLYLVAHLAFVGVCGFGVYRCWGTQEAWLYAAICCVAYALPLVEWLFRNEGEDWEPVLLRVGLTALLAVRMAWSG